MDYCYICYTENVDPEWICDICGENYCEDCSYTFSIHFQYQGSRCYLCSNQMRRNPLPPIEVLRERKINLYVGNISK